MEEQKSVTQYKPIFNTDVQMDYSSNTNSAFLSNQDSSFKYAVIPYCNHHVSWQVASHVPWQESRAHTNATILGAKK